MKKSILLFFITVSAFCQESDNLKFKSISTGFGICAGELNSGGICLYIDGTTSYKKNLFSVSFSIGGEFNIFSSSHRDFRDFGILYGREIKISKVIKIETHLGFSNFNETYSNRSTNFKSKSETVLGIPIKVKFLFYTSKHFALGLNPNITFNSIENTYSGNLTFQYNFLKNK